MTTPDVHLLTGAYAVDALDEFERRQFERHLAECPECTQEVAELRATAARLGLAVSEEPPTEWKNQVLTRIAQVRQDPPRTPGTGPRERERDARTLALRLVSAAAAVAIAAAATLGVVAVRSQHQLDSAHGDLTQVQAQQSAVADLLSAPDLRIVPAQNGKGSVLISQRLNRGMVLLSGMPDQSATSTYQAWAIAGGVPRSLGLLGPGGTSATPLVFDGLQGVQRIAMTVEPAGGSVQPTTTPVASFAV
ncbi:anti-sigma factor [Amycolatopsis alkalitolerans]|uniref:Regulator of SigK n=1 Tax=Amycolatopsis alkalitolerans TaxID=2547244 RepID=A0A5C4LSJ0_9PSEU|nr:anti-sigma factor [Amycolatopsis alkalitolerans]TNC20587.1 anti-sigma factor [Amycolatopsis alkalitolerans]